jgi:hypothetical protein
MNSKKYNLAVWIELIRLVKETSGAGGPCEHGNEHSGSIKGWEILD